MPSETRRFAGYNEEIVRSALVLKLLAFQKTGAILAAAGAEVVPLAADLSQPSEVLRLLDEAESLTGGLDIVHNNAADRPWSACYGINEAGTVQANECRRTGILAAGRQPGLPG